MKSIQMTLSLLIVSFNIFQSCVEAQVELTPLNHVNEYTVDHFSALEQRLLTRILSLEQSLTLRMDNLEKSMFKSKSSQNSGPKIKTSGNFRPPGNQTTALVAAITEIRLKLDNLTTIQKDQESNVNLTTTWELNSVKRALQLELRTLQTRLDDLRREVMTNNEEVSSIFAEQIQNLTFVLEGLQREERKKRRIEGTKIIVEAVKVQNQWPLARAELDLLNQDLTIVMPSVVNASLRQTIQKFDQTLEFLRTLPLGQFRVGIEAFIDLLTSQRFVDTPQFINLAFMSKRIFGDGLKSKFPRSIQNLVFGGNLCIRNSFTNQLLTWKGSDGSTIRGQLPTVITRRPSSTRGGVEEFCRWKMYRLDERNNFIIRREEEEEGINVNMKYVNPQIVLSPSDGHSLGIVWEIESKDNGEVLAIKLLDGKSKLWLCVTDAEATKGEDPRRSRGTQLKEMYGQECGWFIESRE